MNTTYDRLIGQWKEIATLGAIGQLLNWDQETYMPPKGAEARAEMMALTAGLAHDKLVRAEIAPMFAGLKAALVPLVQGIAASKRKPDSTILTRTYPVERQKEFGLSVIRDMGFDLEAGRLDVSAHPFCSGFAPQDVRLTTR